VPEEFPLWPDNPTKEDLLGFADVATPVIDALGRERLDPVALGVFGDWGSGKTTILKLIESSLDEDDNIVVVYTQPWEYDPSNDPKAILIGEVLSAIREHAESSGTKKLSKALTEKFKDLAKRIRWSKAIGLAARSAVSFTPPSFEAIADIFGDEKGSLEPTLQGFRGEFASLMDELESVSRVVVLVDDLDRCLPPAVIGTLEAIKLFLSVKKMGFVVAADERAVRHAIASQYEGSTQSDRLAQEYLEKIVQIPMRVPALGESDAEAYLALLLLHRHLADGPEYNAIVEYIDGRREVSALRVLEGLPETNLSQEAKDELKIAGQLAPVLTPRVDGNPRRLKRFMNAFWLRSDIAKRRDAALEPLVMAKLLLLERFNDDGFRVVLRWLGTDELQTRLAKLEEAENDEGLEKSEKPLFDWAHTPPKVAGTDLAPYLRLAASLTSFADATSGLRPEILEIVKKLSGDEVGPRKEAVEKAENANSEDQGDIGRELARIVGADPGRQSSVGTAVSEVDGESLLVSEFISGLQNFDAHQVEPDLVIRLKDIPGGSDLIQSWKATGNLTSVAAKAADGQSA
jgi:hypothetical protein